VLFVSGTAIKIKVKASGHAAGAVDVTVTTAGGTSANTTIDDYTYQGLRVLTVNKIGTGFGSVTCNGGPCAVTYAYGSKVTLAASAASGSTFTGWSGGGCAGMGTCVVTLNADTAVTATFDKKPPTEESESSGVSCVVPKLRGVAFGKAKSALKSAHCTLGKVTKLKAKKGKKRGPLVVKSSKPGAGMVLPENSKVDLKLGPKPKKKK
jgi:hypothetical protein